MEKMVEYVAVGIATVILAALMVYGMVLYIKYLR
jgi:hypothetical protein